MRHFAANIVLDASANLAARTFDLTQLTAADIFTLGRGYGFDLGTAPGTSGKTFYFSVAVPEGNWRGTVTFGDPAVASDNTVKAESRRLVVERLATTPAEFVTRSFIVNVRNRTLPPPLKNAPGGSTVLANEREEGSFTWDDKLKLEFYGRVPRVRTIALEPADVPTIYLLATPRSPTSVGRTARAGVRCAPVSSIPTSPSPTMPSPARL